MNIHEYQAKQVLKKYGVPTSHGVVALKADDIDDLLNNFNAAVYVVKAQIHAGGRGKGKVVGNEQRGVAVAKSEDDVKTIAGNLLDGTLVTIQTGAAGKLVNKILIAQDVYYPGPNEVK